MNDRGADKKAGMPDGHDRKGSETPGRLLATRQTVTARLDQAGDEARSLMEEVLRRENVHKAYQRVVRNGGAPGIDGTTVDDLMEHCRSHWPRIREQLLCMSYTPQPVRKVEVPKLDGKGTRMLGIPTVLDRMIQQALFQILQPIFDPTFSDASFGFRPGRSTHGALRRAREHIAGGSRWCVDLDFAKFLDSEVAEDHVDGQAVRVAGPHFVPSREWRKPQIEFPFLNRVPGPKEHADAPDLDRTSAPGEIA